MDSRLAELFSHDTFKNTDIRIMGSYAEELFDKLYTGNQANIIKEDEVIQIYACSRGTSSLKKLLVLEGLYQGRDLWKYSGLKFILRDHVFNNFVIYNVYNSIFNYHAFNISVDDVNNKILKLSDDDISRLSNYNCRDLRTVFIDKFLNNKWKIVHQSNCEHDQLLVNDKDINTPHDLASDINKPWELKLYNNVTKNGCVFCKGKWKLVGVYDSLNENGSKSSDENENKYKDNSNNVISLNMTINTTTTQLSFKSDNLTYDQTITLLDKIILLPK